MSGKDFSELVSVIMPVYNEKKEYLELSVGSILSQSYNNIELIIIDSSTDLTIWDFVKRDDKRIRYYWVEKNGIASALNFGIQQARGNYIARMDSDDIANLRRIEKQISYMCKHKEVDIIGSYAEVIDETNKVERVFTRHPFTTSEIKAALMFGTCFIHPTVMFRRRIIDKGFMYDESFLTSEDYEAWTRLVLIYNMANIPDILLQYRIHGENASIKAYLETCFSDAEIIFKYIRNAFHIDMSQYEIGDICPQKNFLNSVDVVRSTVKKIMLMNAVVEKNREMNYLDEDVLLNTIFQNKEHVLSFFDFPQAYENDVELKKNWDFFSKEGSFLKYNLMKEFCCREDDLYNSLEEVFNNMNVAIKRKLNEQKTFILYGLGARGARFVYNYWESDYKDRHTKWEIKGLCDMRESKYERFENKYEWVSLEELSKNFVDYVIVTAKSFKGIKDDLIKLGVDGNRIMSANMFI